MPRAPSSDEYLGHFRAAFADALRETRKAAGVTQEQLALDLGLDRRRIYEWESAIYLPGLEQIVRISAALHVNPGYLLLRAEHLARFQPNGRDSSSRLAR